MVAYVCSKCRGNHSSADGACAEKLSNGMIEAILSDAPCRCGHKNTTHFMGSCLGCPTKRPCKLYDPTQETLDRLRAEQR